MRLISRGNYLIWHAPLCACASHLSHPVHRLIKHTVQVVFVLFLPITLNGLWRISRNRIHLLHSLLQIIHNHWLLHSFLFDPFQLQRRDGLADDFGLGVNGNELFVMNFVEMVSLGEVDISWDVGVPFLNINDKITRCSAYCWDNSL